MSRTLETLKLDYIHARSARIGQNVLTGKGDTIPVFTGTGTAATTAAGSGGNSSAITLETGDGGASSTTNAGSGGDLNIVGGDGGNVSGAAATGTGGTGGNIEVSSGSGGTAVATGTDGVDGAVKLGQNPPFVYAGTPVAITLTGARLLVNTECRTGLIILAGAAGAVALTFPTAANLVQVFSTLSVGDTFYIDIYNGNNGAVTMTGNTNLVVNGGNSAIVASGGTGRAYFRYWLNVAVPSFEVITSISLA